MGGSNERAAGQEGPGVDSKVWRIVDAQYGVIARAQLLELGLSRHAIQHRLARGRLRLVSSGVYVVGRPELTRHGRWMAAVLACGTTAMLSHGSAAALWGIGAERWEETEISVRVASRRRRAGLRVYRRPTLAARDVDERARIPVTGIVQTIVDLAARLGRGATERLVNEADRLELIDPPTLRRELEAHRCEPGVRPLRTLMDRRTFRLTRSELERYFLPLAKRAGLPLPLTKQWVNNFEVDFYWPQLGLLVETDGLQYHRTPAQQAHDRLRDQTHTAAGLRPLRFTHEQVRYEPQHVLAILRATAQLLGVAA
jgi:very-short-patch-repair endonuclease